MTGLSLRKGDLIKPARKTPVVEEVVACDGVRVTTKYEYGDETSYFTREMRDVERYWEKADDGEE